MKLKRLLSLVAMIFALGGGSLWAQYTTGSTVAAGDYFLYNIAAQKFLTNGMDWGTHATVDNAGRVITLAALPDGKYSIYTKNYSSDDAKGYMTTNGYVDTGSNDANWIFTPVSVDGYTNVYTIKNSDTQYLYYDVADSRIQVGNATGTNADYWIIVPKSVRDAAGEVTYLLQNTDFNRPWERAIWEGAKDDRGKAQGVGGSESNRNQERYNMTFDVNQTVSGVTNGIYRFTCQGFYRNGTTNDQYAMMYINSTTYPLKNIHADGQASAGNGFSTANGGVYVPNSQADASNVFDAGYYQNEMAAIVTDGTLKLGFKKDVEKASDWSLFDNIKLYNKLIPGSNVTSLITNPSFETGNGDGWEFNSANDTGVKENSNNTYKTEGVNGYYLFNTWGGTTEKYIQQTVSGLPEGVYELKALFASDNGLNMKLYANDDFSEVTTTGKGQFVECSVTTKIAEGGNLKIKATSTDWYKVDNFRLTYVGNYVEHYATPLPAEATTANDWYAYTINVDGDYKITSSVNATIKYTQNGSQERGQVTTSVNCVASEPQMLSLTAGTIYVSPSVAATITIEANNNVYYVGEATCDMAYAQPGQTVTVNYAEAMTNDGTAPFAKKGNPNVTVNGTAVQNINVTGTSFTFTMPEVAANGTYTLNIPADAFGYAKGNTYNAEQSNITIKTPAIYDQTTYIYSPLRNKFLSRGMESGTSAILDNYGIPVNIRTNAEGKTTVQFVDNERYLFGANWAWTDGVDANITYYTVETFTSTTSGHVGYKFISNAGKTGAALYINHGTIDRLANNSADGSNLYNDDYCVFQLKTKGERNAIKEGIMLAQLVDVAENAGETISDEDGFNSLLSSLTSNVDLTSYVKDAALAGTVDAWNPTNIRTWANGGPKYASNENGTEFYQSAEKFSQTVSNLPKGIYKVTLSGYFRESSNANCVTWADYDMSTAFIEANGYQVNFKTWASDRSANDAPNGMGAAKALFEAGKYKNELYTYVGEDGKLTLTISNPNCLPNGWMMFKDLKLTFYTTKADNVADGVHYYYGGAWNDEAVELTNDVPVLDVTNATGSFKVTAANANGLVYTNGATINDVTNNIVSNGTCANLVLTDGGTFKAHKNFEATSATYTMGSVATTSDGKTFGTLMVPFVVSTQPASNTAYALAEVAFGEEIHATEANAIEANKPVLVTKSGNYTASNVQVAATADTYTNGELVGTYKAMEAPASSYVLQNHSGRVAFFMVGSTQPTVNPFRAYIKAQSAGARDFLNVVFDDETAINEIENANLSGDGAIYDLAGRRVNNAVKGIYIINGKKVIK